MFSKRSVIGQPTSTPTEYGVMPAALSVSAASFSPSQSSGGSTPASSKAATLYQMVDLLAALNRIPYWVPSTAPTSATDSPKFSTIGVAHVVERLDRALLGKVRHQARLADRGDVGRIPTLDRGREQRSEVVPTGGVLHGDVRIQLLEARDHCFERLLLLAGPDRHDRDLAGDVLAALGARLRRRLRRIPRPRTRARLRAARTRAIVFSS